MLPTTNLAHGAKTSLNNETTAKNGSLTLPSGRENCFGDCEKQLRQKREKLGEKGCTENHRFRSFACDTLNVDSISGQIVNLFQRFLQSASGGFPMVGVVHVYGMMYGLYFTSEVIILICCTSNLILCCFFFLYR